MAARDIVIIVVVLFILAVSIFVSVFVSNKMNTALRDNSVINSTAEAVVVIDSTEHRLAGADGWYFAFFIFSIISLLITGWLVGGHPIFMVAYFLVIVIAVVLGAVLSNVWIEFSTNAVFAGELAAYPLTNNILTNLPYYMAVIGFLGMVAMYAKPLLQGGVE